MKNTYLKMYFKYVVINLKSIMVYDWDYIFGIIAMILKCVINFSMLLLMFGITDNIAGWSFDQMLFLYGMSTVCFALWHCFFTNIITIPTYIQSGEFDRFLLKPIDPLFQIMMEGFDEDGWGELIFGAIILTISITKLDYVDGYIFLIPVFCMCGCLIAAGLSIFCSSLAFMTIGNIDLTDNIMDFKEFAKYPLTIFNKGIVFLFSFIIPIGFTAYYPGMLYIRNENNNVLLSFLSIPISFAFFGFSWIWWHHALKKYNSSGH